MGRRVGFLAMLVTAGLSMGSASAVAQSGAPTPVVSFTGMSYPAPCEDATPAFQVVDGIQQMRGMDCHGSTVATDPRFKGTYLTAVNADRYPEGADGSQLTVTTVVRRVENADGAWQGSAITVSDTVTASGTDDPPTPETVVFTGEGGYAGLTAVVVFSPFANSQLRGVIFRGSPPPPPALPAASPAG